MNVIHALIANPIAVLALAVISVINWRLIITLIVSIMLALLIIGSLYLLAR